MVIGSMILPLVLLLVPVLLTTYRYPLATASDPDDCELCTDGPEDRIKLRYSDSSSGQISGQFLVCFERYWRTVCDSDQKKEYKFTDTDASVACYQLGFTSSSRPVATRPLPQVEGLGEGTGTCRLACTVMSLSIRMRHVRSGMKNSPDASKK